MTRVEAAVMGGGWLLMGLALVAFDWRVGLFFAGFGLFLSSIDLPWRRP